jgi:ABC-type phosphate transport system substrate-binding protein
MRLDAAASETSARWAVACVLLLGLGLPGERVEAQGATGYQVIVNVANPAMELARAEVSRWFLKQSTKWPDGKVVVPLDQSARSEVRAAFSLGVHKQPLQAIETYWQKQIFSGRTVPPFVKVGDADVMAYIAGNTSAIGYVSGNATLVPGVKVVKIKE